jgi:hypothetical protein
VPAQLADEPMSAAGAAGAAGDTAESETDDPGLSWRLVRVRALGLPLPSGWFAGVRAREFERDGRYHFDVGAQLPVVGLLVRYRGWLDVED